MPTTQKVPNASLLFKYIIWSKEYQLSFHHTGGQSLQPMGQGEVPKYNNSRRTTDSIFIWLVTLSSVSFSSRHICDITSPKTDQLIGGGWVISRGVLCDEQWSTSEGVTDHALTCLFVRFEHLLESRSMALLEEETVRGNVITCPDSGSGVLGPTHGWILHTLNKEETWLLSML